MSGSTAVTAGALQPRDQPRGPTASSSDHRRHVERLRQRLPHRHRAAVEAVEILRRVAAEAGRPVLDQAFRMREPSLEGEPDRSAASASSPASAPRASCRRDRRRRSSKSPPEPTEARIAPASRRPRRSRPTDRSAQRTARSRGQRSRGTACRCAGCVRRCTARPRVGRHGRLREMRRQHREGRRASAALAPP